MQHAAQVSSPTEQLQFAEPPQGVALERTPIERPVHGRDLIGEATDDWRPELMLERFTHVPPRRFRDAGSATPLAEQTRREIHRTAAGHDSADDACRLIAAHESAVDA